MVRYFGLYANAHRGESQEGEHCPLAMGMIEEEPKPVSAKGWATMVRKASTRPTPDDMSQDFPQ